MAWPANRSAGQPNHLLRRCLRCDLHRSSPTVAVPRLPRGSPRSGAARERSSIRESSTLWRGRCGPSSTAGPAGVRRRRHARLLSAMAVFLIGAIGTAAAAVTSESGPSLAGPSQVRSAPANALSSAQPGALTPQIPSSPGRATRKGPTAARRLPGADRAGGDRTHSQTGGAGTRTGVGEGARGGSRAAPPRPRPRLESSGDTVVADSGSSTTPPAIALPDQVPALSLPDPALAPGRRHRALEPTRRGLTRRSGPAAVS